eukprot:TRINITY_DN93659_c0_g1_i1.p1 TRINITY_DN93659_c0_g1~~TRINITY_DN93659_c0_g1_i1.p1  ORF type:complete len:245 (+),score=79.06 TRINITY_DN93659_c0_g1_i1:65-799(+)
MMLRDGGYYDAAGFAKGPPQAATFEGEGADIRTEQLVSRIQALTRGRQARRSVIDQKNLTTEQVRKLEAAQNQADKRRDFFKDVHGQLGISRDAYNASMGMQQVREYLQRQKIPQLLDSLLARVALDRPEDLRGYLVDVLRDMKREREGDTESMGPFEREDVETMFGMWDEREQGRIPATKLLMQLKALHVKEPRLEMALKRALKVETIDSEAMQQEVDEQTFVTVVSRELQVMFSADSFHVPS